MAMGTTELSLARNILATTPWWSTRPSNSSMP